MLSLSPFLASTPIVIIRFKRESVLTFQAIVQGVAILVGIGDGLRLGIYQQNGIVFVKRTGFMFTKGPTHSFSSLSMLPSMRMVCSLNNIDGINLTKSKLRRGSRCISLLPEEYSHFRLFFNILCQQRQKVLIYRARAGASPALALHASVSIICQQSPQRVRPPPKIT